MISGPLQAGHETLPQRQVYQAGDILNRYDFWENDFGKSQKSQEKFPSPINRAPFCGISRERLAGGASSQNPDCRVAIQVSEKAWV
jgi:hypothetical protein